MGRAKIDPYFFEKNSQNLYLHFGKYGYIIVFAVT